MPGALPALRQLHIYIADASLELPSSWGYPGVLPSLKYLSFELHRGKLQGCLPVEWALGFRSLLKLFVHLEMGSASQRSSGSGDGEPAPARASMPLPEWPGGFPALRILSLSGLGCTGGLPSTWMNGSMPALEEL